MSRKDAQKGSNPGADNGRATKLPNSKTTAAVSLLVIPHRLPIEVNCAPWSKVENKLGKGRATTNQ